MSVLSLSCLVFNCLESVIVPNLNLIVFIILSDEIGTLPRDSFTSEATKALEDFLLVVKEFLPSESVLHSVLDNMDLEQLLDASQVANFQLWTLKKREDLEF